MNLGFPGEHLLEGGGLSSEEIEPAQRRHFVIQSRKVMVEIMELETN